MALMYRFRELIILGLTKAGRKRQLLLAFSPFGSPPPGCGNELTTTNKCFHRFDNGFIPTVNKAYDSIPVTRSSPLISLNSEAGPLGDLSQHAGSGTLRD